MRANQTKKSITPTVFWGTSNEDAPQDRLKKNHRKLQEAKALAETIENHSITRQLAYKYGAGRLIPNNYVNALEMTITIYIKINESHKIKSFQIIY